MPGSSASVRTDDSVLPAIPTSLVEVEVVERWRDGVPAMAPVAEVDGSTDLSAPAAALDVDVAVLRTLGATASAGEVRTVPLADENFGWVVGVGSGEPAQWRRAGAALARAIRERLGADDADDADPDDLGDAFDAEYVQVRLPADVDADTIAALTLGLSLGGYRFRVTAEQSPPRLRKALLVARESADVDELRETARRARHSAAATALTRDLANAPSNIKDPAWLTSTAAELAAEVPGLRASVRDEKWLSERGFGGILAGGGGLARPPRPLGVDRGPPGGGIPPPPGGGGEGGTGEDKA